jgi:hypothetical protein
MQLTTISFELLVGLVVYYISKYIVKYDILFIIFCSFAHNYNT